MNTHSLDTVRSVLAQVKAANADLTAALRLSGQKRIEKVKQALERGAQLDSVRSRGPMGRALPPALHEALQKSSPELLSLLLQYGADPNQCDSARKTPLMEAACLDAAWAIPLLHRAGANPYLDDPVFGTAIALAIGKGADNALDALLALPDIGGIYLRNMTISGLPYLSLAHTPRAIRSLVASGVDPHQIYVTEHEGQRLRLSSLDWLLKSSSDDPVDAAQALLDAGVLPSSGSLLWAAQGNKPKCLALLDALGLNWDEWHRRQGTRTTPLKTLMETCPTLGSHWKNVLEARKQAAALCHALVETPQESAQKLRL